MFFSSSAVVSLTYLHFLKLVQHSDWFFLIPRHLRGSTLTLYYYFLWLGCGKLPAVFYKKKKKKKETALLWRFFGFHCDRDSTEVFRGSWMNSAIAGLCSSCGLNRLNRGEMCTDLQLLGWKWAQRNRLGSDQIAKYPQLQLLHLARVISHSILFCYEKEWNLKEGSTNCTNGQLPVR